MFCVIVSPGKGSSQGSLTCPHAQGLLCRPVLEDYPLTSFQMLLLQVLQLETFSPLQSPAYTKARGLSLKQRERVPEVHLQPPVRPTSNKTPGDSPLGVPEVIPGSLAVPTCLHRPFS